MVVIRSREDEWKVWWAKVVMVKSCINSATHLTVFASLYRWNRVTKLEKNDVELNAIVPRLKKHLNQDCRSLDNFDLNFPWKAKFLTNGMLSCRSLFFEKLFIKLAWISLEFPFFFSYRTFLLISLLSSIHSSILNRSHFPKCLQFNYHPILLPSKRETNSIRVNTMLVVYVFICPTWINGSVTLPHNLSQFKVVSKFNKSRVWVEGCEMLNLPLKQLSKQLEMQTQLFFSFSSQQFEVKLRESWKSLRFSF
jgi:hypothetical protein